MLTDDAIRSADIKILAGWINSQPAWSDFPFVLLTERGGILSAIRSRRDKPERSATWCFWNGRSTRQPWISVVRTALRSRKKQYEARSRLEALHESEGHARQAEASARGLNETLEARVRERTEELAATNRQLVAQIEEREKVKLTLRQMQRLEAIGQLTSGVAHDFNNLLTVVLGNIGFLGKSQFRRPGHSKLKQRLSHMRLAAERGAKLTSQLLAFSRRQRLEPEAVRSEHGGGEYARSAAKHAGRWHQQSTPYLGREFGPRWPTRLRSSWLSSISSLTRVTPCRDRGTVTIETANAKIGLPEKPEEPPAGDYVMIAVADTGSGMTKDVLAKAFEPFFTTKEIGKGSGLGLSQVLGFAKQSGGGMRIETRVGEGTSVKIYLPRALDNFVYEVSAVTVVGCSLQHSPENRNDH